jgi:hypothetical protein
VIESGGNVRVLVATKPVDFREGADGLATLVREEMRVPSRGGKSLVGSKRVGAFVLPSVIGRHRVPAETDRTPRCPE